MISKVPLYEQLNPPLLKKVYDLKENDQGITKSNVLGWHSSGKLDEVKEFAFLKNLLDVMINNITLELGYDVKLYMSNSWATINHKYASNQVHNHGHSFFSGAYYLKIPEPLSNIIFYDPRSIKSFNTPKISDYNEYTSNTIKAIPQPGVIIVFPSWLSHSVEPNMSDEDRVSISFNYTIKY